MTTKDNPTVEPRIKQAAELVSILATAIDSGEARLESVPGLLKRVIRENLWQEYTLPRSSIVVKHETFSDFINEGLHTNIQTLKELCRRDTEALDLLDKVTARGVGQHQGNQYTNGNVDIVNNSIEGRPDGNSQEAALRRLRKERPDIHQRIIAGEMSAHAGMIEAGFRKRAVTLSSNPEKAAEQIRKHFTPEEVREIASRLNTPLKEKSLPMRAWWKKAANQIRRIFER